MTSDQVSSFGLFTVRIEGSGGSRMGAISAIDETDSGWSLLLDLAERAVLSIDDRRPKYISSRENESGLAEISSEFKRVSLDSAGEVVSNLLNSGPVFLLPEWGGGRVPNPGETRMYTERLGKKHYLFEPATTLLGIESSLTSPLVVILPANLMSSSSGEALRRGLLQKFDLAFAISSSVGRVGTGAAIEVVTVILVPKGESSLTRWFAVPRTNQVKRIRKSFGHVLKIREGSNSDGYVVNAEVVNARSWAFEAFDPRLTETERQMSVFGQTVPLGDIATIARGEVRGQSRRENSMSVGSGSIPVLGGRNILSNGSVSFDARDTTEGDSHRPQFVSADSQEASDGLLQVDDLVIGGLDGGRDSKLRVARIRDSDLPLVASKRDFVVRFNKGVSEHQSEMVFFYLRSTTAKKLLRNSGQLQITVDRLRTLPVPLPDSELAGAFGALREASDEFESWRRGTEELLISSFDEADFVAARGKMLQGSRTLRAKLKAGQVLDEFDHIVWTQYPYPIAFRYRTVTSLISAGDNRDAYDGILGTAEALFALMGSMALAWAFETEHLDRVAARIRSQFSEGKGVGFGDWHEVLKTSSSGEYLQSTSNDHPVRELAAFVNNPDVEQARIRLKERRDNNAHDRKVETPALREAIEDAMADLHFLLAEAEFLMDIPLLEITDVKFNSRLGRSDIFFRGFMGDHPIKPTEVMRSVKQFLEKDSLYCIDDHSTFHLMGPLLIIQDCPQCHSRSVFHIDRITKEGVLEMKSLENGHTIPAPDPAAVFEAIGCFPKGMVEMSAIVVDIDGTVALHGDRSPYDFTLVSGDSPNQPVVSLVRNLAEQHVVIFVSGRDDSCEKDTRVWLEEHVGISFELFMRATGDQRKDSVVKQEIFENLVRPNYDVWLVLDDRDQTVAMWRSLGLTCLQVAPGDF